MRGARRLRRGGLAASCAIAAGLLASGPSEAVQAVPGHPCFVFQQMGDEVRLTTRSVVALVQDSRGFIWIGTLDGLLRYDGEQARSYGQAEGLPSSYIVQILEGPDGTLWVLTHAGVARSEGSGFVAVETGDPGDMGARLPQRMAVDARGNLYVATTGGLELHPAGGGATRTWSTAQGLPHPGVDAVHAAAEGTVWFASVGSIGTLDPASGRIRMQPSTAWPADEQINSILTDHRGTVWVRTTGHLARLDPGTDGFVLDDEGLPPASLYGMPSLDRDGNILVPTDRGLFYEEDGGWTSVSKDGGLPSNIVFSALEDHEGAVWIGFGGLGIVRWPGRHQWRAWTSAQGLPDDTVWQSTRDLAGRLWVGTSNGVGVWDPATGSWRVLTEADGLAGPGVWQLALGQDGRMWSISSLGELTRYDPATLQPEKVPLPGIGGGRMARLVAGPDRTLWLSSYEHLFAIRLVEGEMTFERMQLPPEAIDCTKVVSPAPDGVIWTGGPAGLCRYDGTWRRFTTRDGLRLDQVDFMAAVSGEEVWFVYQDLVGVAHVKLVDGEPEIRHFGTAQGLPSNTVYSLGLDARGRLWAGGNAGLVLFSRDGPSRVYDMNDGLIWDDLSSHSFLAEPDGSFFIGTSRGLARFDPSGRAPVERPPRIVVTSALTGDVERLGEDSPVVPYAERTFQVAYSALTFRDPQAVRFRYRLLPLEDEYLETAMREVRYPGLQARDYMFEVVAISASGLWSVEPATFSFTIRPPWWGTWWARVIAIALVMLLIASIVWLRTRRLDLARRRLEAAVAERSAELARANKELEEMSHTDVLTDTRNRRYFMSVIDDNVARVLRRHDRRSTTESGINRGIVFYIIDIDWFKKVNDEHGHRTGDRVLADVARRISSVLRQSDLLVRWGGEEFLVVCSDSEPSQGSQVSKRILDAVGTAPFDLGDGSVLRRTCSIGWAGFPWIAGDPGAVSYETVIELADKGLYLAKASGRNMAIGVMPLSGSPPSSWLDAPLAALEGSKVELVRTPGPDQPPG